LPLCPGGWFITTDPCPSGHQISSLGDSIHSVVVSGLKFGVKVGRPFLDRGKPNDMATL
jgi:hypothetical protein